MKNIIKAFRLTVVMCVLLGVGYMFVLWIFWRNCEGNAINFCYICGIRAKNERFL